MRLHRPIAARAAGIARRTLIALLTLGALAMSACGMAEESVNVNQSRIWTDYELEYDANADVTVARASFRFGSSLGTQLRLTAPSEIRFNGALLAEQTQMGTGLVRYERTFPGLVSSGTFRFVDTEDEAYSNSVTLRPVEFPATVGPIDNDNAFAFDWVGGALVPDERVSVTLSRFSTTGSPALALFPQSQDGARGVIMDATQLRNVTAGDVTLKMERSWSGTPGRAPDAGGKLAAKWTARERVATVVD